ncbi:hypothetical protein LMH73_004770 [Vibrio splendidus]|nr:hypothetical protein [Vibrio splendidus]MCC4882542.1 hypothetical protein [Vibrio splendidus]
MKKSYYCEMRELAKELGHLIAWSTNVGEPINQLCKLLGVSRSSHDAYLKNSDAVPDYIWNQIKLFKSLRPHQRLEHGFNALTNIDNLTLEDSLALAVSGWELMTGRIIREENNRGIAGRFSLSSFNTQLVKLIDDDSSCIAASLYLLNGVKGFTDDFKFDFESVYGGCEKSDRIALGAKQVDLFINSTEIGVAIRNFESNCRTAISFYKPDSKIDNELIDSAIDLLIDAKKAFSYLPKFTVSKDAISALDTSLKIQEKIFVFESVADLIEHSTLLPNGFSLNMIRTARATDSFFCIVVKNGENVHLITDKPAMSEHQKDRYSRRNQRYNTMRFESSYFPYEMMGLLFSDAGRRIDISDCKDLVVQENGLRVLGHFKDMSDEKIIWFTFLFEECKEMFFDNGSLALPDLAFIGNHAISHLLVDNADRSSSTLPVSYVAKGSIEQKQCSELNRKDFERLHPSAPKSQNINKWMLDKFESMIDDSLIYIPESIVSKGLCLEDNSGKLGLGAQGEPQNDNSDDLPINLKTIPSTLIGSQGAIQAEIDYIARKNKANAINHLAVIDYNERKESMQKWFARKVKANLQSIVDRMVSLDHDAFSIAEPLTEYLTSNGLSRNLYDQLRQVHVTKHSGTWDFRVEPTPLQKALRIRNAKNYSFCTMSRVEMPFYCFYLNVANAFDLERVLGIPRKKLPVELRNWRLMSSGVNDVDSPDYDPLDVLRNPWNAIEFKLQLPLDMEYVKKRRSELGLNSRFAMPYNYFDESYGRKMQQELVDKIEAGGFSVGAGYSKPKIEFSYGAQGLTY